MNEERQTERQTGGSKVERGKRKKKRSIGKKKERR